MQRRLERARTAPADADRGAKTATVARTSGFTNMSHFSQVESGTVAEGTGRGPERHQARKDDRR